MDELHAKRNYLSIFGHIWTAVSKMAITSSSGLQSSQSNTFSVSTEKELQFRVLTFCKFHQYLGEKSVRKLVTKIEEDFLVAKSYLKLKTFVILESLNVIHDGGLFESN